MSWQVDKIKTNPIPCILKSVAPFILQEIILRTDKHIYIDIQIYIYIPDKYHPHPGAFGLKRCLYLS